MYKIGIIDDEISEIRKIRGAIKTNALEGVQFDFKIYSLEINSGTLTDDIVNEVIEDIKENNISTLIIDQKIMIETNKVTGADIYNKIKDAVPKFPMIILTNYVEDNISNKDLDPDKVYKKSLFFKIEEEYSKDMVRNIFINASKYKEDRAKLELEVDELKEEIEEKGNKKEVIAKMIDKESELDNFCPTDQTQIDKVFNADRIEKILKLIKEANELLE